MTEFEQSMSIKLLGTANCNRIKLKLTFFTVMFSQINSQRRTPSGTYIVFFKCGTYIIDIYTTSFKLLS